MNADSALHQYSDNKDAADDQAKVNLDGNQSHNARSSLHMMTNFDPMENKKRPNKHESMTAVSPIRYNIVP